MWAFLKNRANTSNDSEKKQRRRPLQFAQLLEGMGDFSDLERDNVALKFWLPEPAHEALRDLGSRNGDSMSEMLRQFFVVHCYGVYAFQVMVETNPDIFRDYEEDSGVRFSRAAPQEPDRRKRIDTYWVPELGKNVVSLKVWLPARVRNDLQTLADHVRVKLSQYLREIVISRLLGHGTLPLRPEMLEAAPLASTEDWCDDLIPRLPMRQVSEEEFTRQTDRGVDGEIRTEWVDT